MHQACFNELSIQQAHHSLNDALSGMDRFTSLLSRLGSMLGRSYSLRTLSEFATYELFHGYCIQQWMNDRRVSKEQRSLLLSLVTKGPYITEDLISTHADVEVFYEGDASKGLLFAYINNAMVLSIDEYANWNHQYLLVEVTKYCDEANDLITKRLNLNHAANLDDLDVHEQWIENCKKSAIQSPDDLFRLKNDYFPNIFFNQECVDQLKQMPGNSIHFNSILGKLFIIQEYCLQTHSQTLDISALSDLGMNVRPDSASTLQKYGDCRMHYNSDGVKELFTFHFDLNPGEWRVYIKWNNTKRSIEFGYIGLHLPTSKFA